MWLTSPKKFIGDTKVEEIEVNKMKLGEPDFLEEEGPRLTLAQNIKLKLI